MTYTVIKAPLLCNARSAYRCYSFSALARSGRWEWKDVDLEAKEWRYFVTKIEVLHIVPLSTQAVAILEEIRPLTGSGRYVFPSSRGDGRPMSDGTIRTALKTLGYDSDVMTAHGFRTIASTLLNEQGWGADAIERQFCHIAKGCCESSVQLGVIS